MIRPERPGDIAAIHEVHTSAFPTDEEARLVYDLRTHSDLAVSLIKDVDDQAVGHIAFSPVTIDGAELVGLGLAPVAVKPEHQRQEFGRELIEAGLAACREREAPFVVVLGDPAYYTPFGFQPATTFHLDNEYGVGDEFMALELQPGVLADAVGLVKYCQAFQEAA